MLKEVSENKEVNSRFLCCVRILVLDKVIKTPFFFVVKVKCVKDDLTYGGREIRPL